MLGWLNAGRIVSVADNQAAPITYTYVSSECGSFHSRLT